MKPYASGPWVTKKHSTTSSVWTANGDTQIAVCRSDNLSKACNKANARLIAAAPDLEIWLGWALRLIKKDAPDLTESWQYEQASIALAKATGDQL